MIFPEGERFFEEQPADRTWFSVFPGLRAVKINVSGPGQMQRSQKSSLREKCSGSIRCYQLFV